MKNFQANLNIYKNYNGGKMYAKKMMIYFNYRTKLLIEQKKFGQAFSINVAHENQLRYFYILNQTILADEYKKISKLFSIFKKILHKLEICLLG